MNDAAAHQVLTDLVHWLLLTLPVAFVVYGWQQRRAGPREPVSLPPPPGVPSDGVDLLVALGLIFTMRSLVAAAPASAEEPEIGLSTVLADLGGKGLLIALLLVFLRGIRGRSLTQWFGLHPLEPGRFAVRAVGWAVGGAGLAYFSHDLVSRFVLEPAGFAMDPQEVVRVFGETSSPVLRLSLAVTACLVAPVVEETIFRGFLYPVLRRFTDGTFAAVFTGVLFGLVHRNLHGAVPLAVLGVALALAYERGRGLALPIAIHALFNTASIVLMWLQPEPALP